jgi:signal transduction histidine kinase
MQTIALITLALTVLINIFFGLAVLLRVYQKPFGWYFVLTVFGVTLWALGDIGLLMARDTAAVHTSALFFYIAPMITPIFIWYFALTFPDDRPLPKWAFFLPIIPFFALSWGFITHFDFFVKSIEVTNSLNIATPQKPGFFLYSAYFSFFFFMAYIAFFRKARQLHGLARTQERYIFYGVLIGSFLALLSNLSLPVNGIREYIWMGPFFSLFFPALATIAIVRHRLFNIRLVLARSIGYIMTVISLAVLYGIAAVTVIDQIAFRDSSIGGTQQFMYALLAAVLAFTFHPVKRFFEKQTNRLFYRDAYEPSVFIDQLNRTLVANIELEPMLKAAANVIQANLKSEFVAFGVLDARDRERLIGTAVRQYSKEDVTLVRGLTASMRTRVTVTDAQYGTRPDKLATVLGRNNIAVLARLVPDGRLEEPALGYLLLGNKKSGNPYTGTDVKIIEIVVNEMVIAVQNALRFQEIEKFNETLQERIDDATRKLRNANDKLRRLNETKDDFISMASHQLRTPLTSVKGYVSMVLDGDAGKITRLQRRLLNQSFVSSQRMVYLISDLLNVSRLKTGKFLIEPVHCNLAKVIAEEVEQLQETAKGRHLTLSYNKPDHFPVLMLDETKLRQVIMNFLDNAVYYTPAGGIIEIHLVDKPHSIEFTVVDNGIGVPRHEQHHLFTKFFRAPNAKRARPDGTGLGLFMAKKVIIAQGGAIIFKSQEGKGSTFGFTFAKSKLTPEAYYANTQTNSEKES